MDNLTNLAQLDTGLQFNFPRILEGENWNEWYKGNYNTLMPSPSVDNGYKLFKANDLIKYPYFAVASDFYVDACWAERPSVSGMTGNRGGRWLDENAERVFQVFRRATQDWAIHGRGIVVVHRDGTIINIDPPNYFRIGEVYEPDDTVAHAICYRYYESTSVDYNPSMPKTPNRIRVIKYYPEANVNTVQTFIYQGTTIGQAVTPVMDAGIEVLCTFGLGDSWYGQISNLMSRFLIQLTNNHASLNWAINSPIALPSSMFETRKPGELMTPQAAMDDYRQIVRPIIGLDDNTTPEPSKLQGAPEYPHQDTHLEKLGLLISQVSKVPPTSFGIGIGAGESGYARERSQDAAAARIRDIRNRIAKCLPVVVRALGAPSGDYSFTWNTSPFEDRVAHQQQLLSLFTAGVITQDEIRAALGYGEMQGEPSQEVNQESAGDE